MMPTEVLPEAMIFTEKICLIWHALPYVPTALKYVRITLKDFAARCKNQLLRKAFELMFVPEMSVIFLFFTLVCFHRKSAGYPIGGSLVFSKRIEKSYLAAGGRIHYRSRVSKILTKGALPNAVATCIQLSSGATYNADIIISATNGHSTLFEMLDEKFLDKHFRRYYSQYHPFPSFLQVSLGIKRTFAKDPHVICIPLESPFTIDPETTTDYLNYRIFNFDKILAPKGKTVVSTLLTTYNYQYWQRLRKDNPARYRDE